MRKTLGIVLMGLVAWTSWLNAAPLGFAHVEGTSQEALVERLQQTVQRIENDIGGRIVHIQANPGEACRGTVLFLADDGATEVFKGAGVGFVTEDLQVEVTTYTRPEGPPAAPEAMRFTFAFPAGSDPLPFLERWDLLSVRFRAGEWLCRYHRDQDKLPTAQRILARHSIRLLAGNSDDKQVIFEETFTARRPPEEMQMVDPAEGLITSPEPATKVPVQDQRH